MVKVTAEDLSRKLYIPPTLREKVDLKSKNEKNKK